MTKKIHKHTEFDSLTLKNPAIRVTLVIYFLVLLALLLYIGTACTTFPTNNTTPDPQGPTLFERPEYRQPLRPVLPADRIRETLIINNKNQNYSLKLDNST